MTGFKHGWFGTSTYDAWAGMLQRCNNPRVINFADYGGRGIQVCGRWVMFENFLADMGPRPAGMTLDRIDNNGDYEPGNCRWTTQRTQARNRRSNHLIKFKGQTRTLMEWGEITGFGWSRIEARLRLGWTVARALTVGDARRKDTPGGRYDTELLT